MTIEGERWRTLRGLFDALVDLPTGEREKRLARAGSADDEIVAELHALLRAADQAGDFLEPPGPDMEPAPYSSLKPGEIVGAFRVEQLVGRGGQGEVYRAVRADGQYEQVVALKLLRPEATGQIERFRNERQLLARLEHPGIARLIDGGIAPDGRLYAAMEFVEGEDIVAYSARERLSVVQRLALVRRVCEAVAYAHRHLVIHRDLKPGNILVTREGEPKLLDFGVARLLGESEGVITEAIVTPDYAAPEQLEGRAPTTATDVYALGACLFELIAGRPPWRVEGSPFPATLRILQVEPPLASAAAREMAEPPVAAGQLSGDIDAILSKTMRRDPGVRYATVDALVEDIDRFLTLRPVAARGEARWHRARLFIRRRKSVLAALMLIGLAIAAFAWRSYDAFLAREATRIETARAAALRDYIMLSFRAAGANGLPNAKQQLDAAVTELSRETKARPEILFTLSELLMEMDDVAAATPLLERYLETAPATEAGRARATLNLAAIAIRKGALDKGRRLLSEARSAWSSEPRRHARQLAEADEVEAAWLRAVGRREEAIALLMSTVSRLQDIVGEDSEALAIAEQNLGVHLLELNRTEEADRHLARAWALLERQGRLRSATAITVLSNRSLIMNLRGKPDEAESLLAEAASLRRTLYGPSLGLAAIEDMRARMLITRGKPEAALALTDETIPMALSFAGEHSPVTIQLRQMRATALSMLERAEEATEEVNRAIDAARQAFGTNHVAHAFGLLMRAAASIRLRRFEAAESDIAAVESVVGQLGAAGSVLPGEIEGLRAAIRAARATAPRPEAP